MYVIRVDHTKYNRTEIGLFEWCDTREEAREIIFSDSRTNIRIIHDEFEEDAELTIGAVSADWEISNELDVYSEYFIHDNHRPSRSGFLHITDELFVKSICTGDEERVRQLLKTLFKVRCVPYEGYTSARCSDSWFSVTFKVTEPTSVVVTDGVGDPSSSGFAYEMTPDKYYSLVASFAETSRGRSAVYDIDVTGSPICHY